MNYTDSFITDKVGVFGRVSEKRRLQVKSANAARWQNSKENPEQAVCIPGSRIMNMGELSKAVKELGVLCARRRAITHWPGSCSISQV